MEVLGNLTKKGLEKRQTCANAQVISLLPCFVEKFLSFHKQDKAKCLICYRRCLAASLREGCLVLREQRDGSTMSLCLSPSLSSLAVDIAQTTAKVIIKGDNKKGGCGKL